MQGAAMTTTAESVKKALHDMIHALSGYERLEELVDNGEHISVEYRLNDDGSIDETSADLVLWKDRNRGARFIHGPAPRITEADIKKQETIFRPCLTRREAIIDAVNSVIENDPHVVRHAVKSHETRIQKLIEKGFIAAAQKAA
jgi:hypothetical protein